jgi:hypothetical protein
MHPMLEDLFSQSYIAVSPLSLEPYHGVLTMKDKMQARERLVGKFKVIPPSLMSPRIYAFLGDDNLNPIEVEKLGGEVRIHFLPSEIFSKANSAGDLQLMEPGRSPVPNTHWLALELFLPDRFFDRVRQTKMISCTVAPLQRENPDAEFSPYHWRNAPSSPLTVRDAHFSDALPRTDD